MPTSEPRTHDPVPPARLRRALGRFATGVAVATALGPEGVPIGMTVNSFTSVSLDPPLILLCLARSSRLHRAFAAANGFAVNVLREGQISLARQFARPGLDRFATLKARWGLTGTPLLPDALAVLECVEPRFIPAGDHDIVLGRVVVLETTADDQAGPLVFFSGDFHSLNTETAWWSAWHE